MKFVLVIQAIFIFTGCSTALEVVSENDSPFGYKSESLEGKKSKYVRQRIVNPSLGYSRTVEVEYDRSIDDYPDKGHFYAEKPMRKNKYVDVSSPDESTHVPNVMSNFPSRNDSASNMFLTVNAGFPQKHSGANFGVGISSMLPALELRAGVSAFNSDMFYLGFDGGIRVRPFEKLSPFVGLGGYLGDAKECESKYIGGGEYLESCEKFFWQRGILNGGFRWT
ncbi:MAG: hypothetical protein R2827_14205 [Bdellovibrionales bacterium]